MLMLFCIFQGIFFEYDPKYIWNDTKSTESSTIMPSLVETMQIVSVKSTAGRS